MKNQILLVNPWITDFAAYDFWIKPLGLLYLASLLRANGLAVRLIDCLDPYHPELQSEQGIQPAKRKPDGRGKFAKEKIPKPGPLKLIPRSFHRYGITPRIFRNEIRGVERPDLILVTSMMTYWYPGLVEAIGILKSDLKGVPVVLGGPYATLCFSHARQNSGADIVLAGEGESSLPPLLGDVLKSSLDFIPDPGDLDSYPYPAFDLTRHLDQVPILTSRGCPFRCTYCASHLLTQGFRRRDPCRVADEITYWNRRFGVKNFSFYDDAFLLDPESMAVPLMKEIIKRGLDCRFHCPNGLHLREVSPDIARLLFRAGFSTLRFGFETSDREWQVKTGAKTTNRNLLDAVQSLKAAGYHSRDIGVYLLCGLPGQRASEVRESIRFVKTCGASPILAEFSPIPGTALWEDAVRVSDYPLREEPLFHNNSLLPCRGDKLTFEDYEGLKKLAREV